MAIAVIVIGAGVKVFWVPVALFGFLALVEHFTSGTIRELVWIFLVVLIFAALMDRIAA